jgi:tetratricopeptide (TPR) repeat protein
MSELEFWKDLGNIFDAVMNYQKKNVEFNNNFINPWIRLGNIFERQDQSNDAVQAYQRAAEIDPNTAQNWVNLGDAQFKKGEYAEAIESYRTAVMLDPEAGWPLGNLALSLVTQGKIEEAIPLYKKSIDLLIEVQDKAICWNRLGNAYRKLNDYENAFLAFQKADQLDGENTGFSDKLDETPPNTPVVAPEEILDQMIADQALQEENEAELATHNVVNDTANDTSQPESEPKTMSFTRVETPDGRIALAPNMEMKVEESVEAETTLHFIETPVEEFSNAKAATEEETPLVLHEKNFDVLQVLEDVIAKVEQAFSEQESSDTDNAPEVESLTSDLPEFNEDPEPEVQDPVSNGSSEEEQVSEKSPRRIPTWLVVKDRLITEEKDSVSESSVQQDLKLTETVTTLSDISQETVVSELVVNMTTVETFTDPLMAPVTKESNASEESIPEPTDQTEGHTERETDEESLGSIAVGESIPLDESSLVEESSTMVTQEQTVEIAYEEYLKDAVEPTKILTDQADDIQSETPITKVSKNGEVRIVMDTKNAHVWNELGNIYLNAGAYDDSIASYSKAIELDRHFAWPYSNLALAYVQKGRFAEAILLYQRGIELFTSDKDKAITWNRLGNVYRRINDYSNAISAYQTADELDPENATLSLRSSFGLLGNMYPDSKPAYVA